MAEPDWFIRYGSRLENFNPLKIESGRKQVAAVICPDGRKLLNAVAARMRGSGWRRSRKSCWSESGRSSSLTTAMGNPVSKSRPNEKPGKAD